MTPSFSRRQCLLTLARREWTELVEGLASLPDTRQPCAEAVNLIRNALTGSGARPDELLTLAQSPLQWSPFVLGLSVHVLRRPDLLAIAERLRDQMLAQARRVEGPPTSTDLGQLVVWDRAPKPDRAPILSPN